MSIEKGTIWAFAAPVVLIIMVSNIAKYLIFIHAFLCSPQINIMFLIMVMVVLVRKSRSKLLDVKDEKHRTIVV